MRKNSVHNDSDSVLMRKLRKILLAVCIIFLAAAVQPLSALAAPEVMPDGSILYTKVSKGSGEISYHMWQEILKRQLKVTQEYFNSKI